MLYFENILDEIEKNITEDVDVRHLAQMANLSLYEFRRIFTFVAKISLAEYIRKRRLSLAATELFEGKATVTDLSIKYGYSSPASFSRAFKEFHGISPSEVLNGNSHFKLLSKIATRIVTTGGTDIAYTLCKKPAFCISGFGAKSELTDTECCEKVWDAFYASPYQETLCAKEHLWAVYQNGADFVHCCIGTEEDLPHMPCHVQIPEATWACFTLNTTEDVQVNALYHDILTQWFASVDYVKNENIPNIEVFPSNMDEENFPWEIWIPVERKM